MNIYLPLQMAADAMPDRLALVSENHRLTYADLAAQAGKISLLCAKGGRLGYLGEASCLLPAALFGAALAGGRFVPLNYRLPQAQIIELIKRVRPITLLTDTDFSEKDFDTDELCLYPLSAGVSSSGMLTEKPAIPLSITRDKAAGSTASTTVPAFEPSGEPPPDGSDVAIELFTSGTTGAPKSALLRHENIMAYILASTEFMSAGEEEATLIAVPPYHIAGISAILSSTYAGRRMVQLPHFEPQAWLALARAEHITHAFLVPTMLQRILETLDETDAETGAETDAETGAETDAETGAKTGRRRAGLPDLRHIAYGGGKMPRSVIERALAVLPGVNFTNAYGLTETSSTISLLTPDDHRAAINSADPAVRRRLTSVGQKLPGVEVEIRAVSGEICAPGDIGLVYVRGPQVSGAYQGAGSSLDAAGWFPTRDRGFIDEAGYLFLDGRDDDVIVRGGENISPGEIEDVIRTHPEIRDVAVVALPDTEWGEAVGAFIVERAAISDEDICARVKAQLRSSRVPKLIRRVEALPYTETGKLLRRVLRDAFTA